MEPVVSTAWDAIEKSKTAPVKPPPNELPNIPRDPLTSFENMIYTIRTDLSGWMTFDKKSRLDRTKWFVDTYTDTSMKMTPDRRHKILNYIIFIESHHPMGDSHVAALAFKGLFPGHQPTQKKVETKETE